MRRVSVLLLALLAVVGAVVPVSAQEAQIEIGFSDEILPTLGYPELAISVGPEGVTAPSSVAAGTYLVRFSSASGYSGYLDFMQPPAGLSEQEATELALAAGANDLAQEGWVYAGGSNTFVEGVPVIFLITLAPGEYQVAASYYAFEEGAEEIMTLVPLAVTEGGTPSASPVTSPMASSAASPAASPATSMTTSMVAGDEPPSTVTLEMTDELRYIVSPDPVPTGPQVWKITNTGQQHAHHVVMSRVSDGTTADDIIGEFTALASGTPPAADSVVAQQTFVGYAALQSGGQTTWVEFDLSPGTYAVVCFIIDPMTGKPHFLDGMVTAFTVA